MVKLLKPMFWAVFVVILVCVLYTLQFGHVVFYLPLP